MFMGGASMRLNPNDGIQYEQEKLHTIWLAGGCFWGVEAYISRLPGVAETTVGYANGKTEYPTYEDVCRRNSGHSETVEVRYDPDVISLKTLLEKFFRIIDPTTLNRQGPDRGVQYRTGIYYHNEADLDIIEAVILAVQQDYVTEIVTEVMPLVHFYPAEGYHQKYLDKNPNGYCHIDLDMLDEEDEVSY